MALRVVYDEREVDPQLAAVCGFYCGACPVYRAWVEQDEDRLDDLAASLRLPREALICTGCRAPGSLCFGRECDVKACAEARGVAFCAECDLFPCEKVERFVEAGAKRAAVLENAGRLREVGWYAWLREQDARWRCPACRAKLGLGDAACRGCGRPVKVA